jgi:hypothetical protein
MSSVVPNIRSRLYKLTAPGRRVGKLFAIESKKTYRPSFEMAVLLVGVPRLAGTPSVVIETISGPFTGGAALTVTKQKKNKPGESNEYLRMWLTAAHSDRFLGIIFFPFRAWVLNIGQPHRALFTNLSNNVTT